MKHIPTRTLTLSLISAAVLTACGGGDTTPPPPADTNAYVQGTAAYGAAMAKAISLHTTSSIIRKSMI